MHPIPTMSAVITASKLLPKQRLGWCQSRQVICLFYNSLALIEVIIVTLVILIRWCCELKMKTFFSVSFLLVANFSYAEKHFAVSHHKEFHPSLKCELEIDFMA